MVCAQSTHGHRTRPKRNKKHYKVYLPSNLIFMSLKKALNNNNNNNNNNKQSKIIPIYKFTFASIKHCGSTILTKTHTHTHTHTL